MNDKMPGSKDLPTSYAIGDTLDWNAPWIDVSLWVELPFWLMMNNSVMSIEFNGHPFPISVHDNYFQLFFGAATDSRESVGYVGPWKRREELSKQIREAIDNNPEIPCMWRKCKTVLKLKSRCNQDVWNAATDGRLPRSPESQLYLAELCRAHIPVINRLIQTYRLATYDYFPFEVSPWDVPSWGVDRDGNLVSANLIGYRQWDHKPVIVDENQMPNVYRLIQGDELLGQFPIKSTPGELELLDALNLMQRGDYSGAVRRVTTAIEVVVENVVGKVVETKKGNLEAKKFLKSTQTRFDQRIKTYQRLTGRILNPEREKYLQETRTLRHKIVHGGYRIGPDERGTAQKAVDTSRWTFNWFENDTVRRDIRERRIAFRSLGRDMTAGVFHPTITPDGVVLSSIREQIAVTKAAP